MLIIMVNQIFIKSLILFIRLIKFFFTFYLIRLKCQIPLNFENILNNKHMQIIHTHNIVARVLSTSLYLYLISNLFNTEILYQLRGSSFTISGKLRFLVGPLLFQKFGAWSLCISSVFSKFTQKLCLFNVYLIKWLLKICMPYCK